MTPTKEQAQAAMDVIINHGNAVVVFNTFPVIDYITALEAENSDLNEVIADKRRLTRELDVAMHGEEGAAKQASLCDLIGPARDMRKELIALSGRYDAMESERNAIVSRLTGEMAVKDRAIARLCGLFYEAPTCVFSLANTYKGCIEGSCVNCARTWAMREEE